MKSVDTTRQFTSSVEPEVGRDIQTRKFASLKCTALLNYFASRKFARSASHLIHKSRRLVNTIMLLLLLWNIENLSVFVHIGLFPTWEFQCKEYCAFNTARRYTSIQSDFPSGAKIQICTSTQLILNWLNLSVTFSWRGAGFLPRNKFGSTIFKLIMRYDCIKYFLAQIYLLS